MILLRMIRDMLRSRGALPRARMVSRGWKPAPPPPVREKRIHGPWNCAMIGFCHDCDEYPPPCCEECRAFGPCTDCDANRRVQDCGDDRCNRKECLEIRKAAQEDWAVRTY